MEIDLFLFIFQAHLLHCLSLCLYRADCLLKSNAKIFDEDPDVAIYLKKANELFRRIILLFNDDAFTDSVGVSLNKNQDSCSG